jgi:AraC-like DNA-binding protein
MTSATSSRAEFWRDPALPYAESRRACHSRACYRPHSHPTFSIGAVDQGLSRFTCAHSGPAVIQPGTMVFVPAAQVHACNPLPETAWSYQMLHLDNAWLQALWREAGLEELQTVRLTRNSGVYARFCQLNGALFSDTSALDKEAALIEFLGDCCSHDQPHQATADQVKRAQAELQPLLTQLQQAVANVPLSDLAKTTGMSRYQVIRMFRAATGLTPHAYQLNQRINHAREGLRCGEPLADVAYRLGFADQAHFQRVFKAHVGVTPGHYQV